MSRISDKNWNPRTVGMPLSQTMNVNERRGKLHSCFSFNTAIKEDK